jgi:very-short-patch-repair endonuclease
MLRGKQIGLRFRREHPIGPYVVDFYCAAAKLCVEVDGPVHDDPSKDRDATRDAWLSSQGFLVLRFSSTDVEESPAQVIARIKQAAPPPSP